MRRIDEHQSLSPASARVRRAQGPARAASLCGEPDVGEKYPPWQTATGRSRADRPAGARAGRCLALAVAAMLLFVAPAQAATTERVSVSSSGAQADAASSRPAVSADGRFVTFISEASNLVAGDTNGVTDVFMRDLTTEHTERISLTASGGQADGPSHWGSISGDGQAVAFMSNASNLLTGAPARTDGESHVYVRDRATGTLEWIGRGGVPSISENGRYVAYISVGYAYNGDWLPGISVYDRLTDTRITHVELTIELGGCGSTFFCWYRPDLDDNVGLPSLAPDASAVAYKDHDAKVLDLITQVEHRASVPPGAPEPNGGSYYPVVAAGQVTFGSYARNLVAGDTNSRSDIFVRRLPVGYSERISVSSSGEQASGDSLYPGLSADGRYVAFSSEAPNLVAGDANGRTDIFLRDLEEKTTTRVSVTAAGGEPNGDSGALRTNGGVTFGVAREAQVIAFGSSATNLVTRDTNGVEDVFVRRR